MKAQARILGVDDGPFRFTDEFVPVVGVVVRAPSYVEAVLMTRVHVDGTDATDVLARAIRGSRYWEGLGLVLLDGAALGGFNVVDVEALHAATDRPVATITRRKPDAVAIERALRARFPDWERRLEILRRRPLLPIETEHKPLYATVACGAPFPNQSGSPTSSRPRSCGANRRATPSGSGTAGSRRARPGPRASSPPRGGSR